MILALNGNRLRKAGQHVLHQLRLGSALAFTGMGHDDALARLRVENAVGAFNGDETAILAGKSGVERVAARGGR